MEKKSKSNVLLVKQLAANGYREKIIKMITGLNQSYINKIINGKLHKETELPVDVNIDMTEEQRVRLNAANKVLMCEEITTNDMNQDIKYMHLLKFFMIEKEDIYNLYQHWSKSKINRYLLKKDVDILTFDSTLIGIEKADYLDLIIDYFLEE